MFKTIFPTRDTTLYSRHPERNTGADQILEITKVASGSAIDDILGSHEYWGLNYNSRFLMDFNITSISASIAAGTISNAKFYLTIKATEAIHLPIEYTLYAYPVSGSWNNGTGYYNNNFQISNGATWQYRTSKAEGTQWNVVGGDFYSASVYEASQAFNYEKPDVRMDVSNIVNAWISGSIPQNGFIIKHGSTEEDDANDYGTIKFFSKDTHTIYIPRLEVFWDDVDVSGTGSINQVTGEDYVVYAKNLKESYLEGETPKIRLGVRNRFTTRSYAVTNPSISTNRLPYNSFFQIMDSKTDEVIVPFDTVGTRISCDTSGNYVRIDMNSFLPERYYKLIFKIETDNGSTINYVDDGLWFKVKRK